MMRLSEGWSHERVSKVKQLWAGGLSGEQIATAIGGVTRNAVMGNLNRLGLTRADQGTGKPAVARPPTPPAARGENKPLNRQFSAAPLPQAAESANPAPLPARLRNGYDPALRRNPSHNILAAISIAGTEPGLPERLKGERPDGTGNKLIDLDSTTCHWPRGNPGDTDFEFCGGYALDGRPYCRSHCALAYLAPQSRSRAPQKMGV